MFNSESFWELLIIIKRSALDKTGVIGKAGKLQLMDREGKK